jgi:hypothetical protein
MPYSKDSGCMVVLSPYISIFPPNKPNDSQIESCEGGKERRMGKVDLPAFINGKSAENENGKRISP